MSEITMDEYTPAIRRQLNYILFGNSGFIAWDDKKGGPFVKLHST